MLAALLNGGAAAAAIVAAGLWLWSANVAIPVITIARMMPDGTIQRPPHEAAFRRQGRLSAAAAIAASMAALLQAATLLLPLLPK